MDNEEAFEGALAQMLAQVEDWLIDRDIDVDRVAPGVLAAELPHGEKIMINQHAPLREIWLASGGAGFHFRQTSSSAWQSTRPPHEDLFVVLARCLNQTV